MVSRRKIREGFIRFRLFPQLLAFTYYHISWMLYVLRPGLSYRLNADFEDHAEHEYMLFVRDTPEMEGERWNSEFEQDYGTHTSVANLLRQIGLDERHHKQQSAARINQARFS